MDHNKTGCETPLTPVLCANGCGFFGSSTTMNFCSKCYRDIVLKPEQEKRSSVQSIMNGNSTSIDSNVAAAPQSSSVSPSKEKIEEAKQGPKRCNACKKRVGLTGFNCRCGSILCSVHRYSDKHECTFDYRREGQETIAKANPVVKADKIVRF